MEEKTYRVFLINPGSTSTKVAYYENEKCILSRSIFHDSSVLLKYPTINDQLDYRMQCIRDLLKDSHLNITGLDAVVGRGGPCCSCESGTYLITPLLVKDTHDAKGHYYHASMLGVQMAHEVQKEYGCLGLMVDPPVVDEMCDEARITGVKGIYRRSGCHVLNSKETARHYARETGKKYEDLNLIIAHIDGGISITCHRHGRLIDLNDTGGGEGPLTPTRMGSMAVTDDLDYFWDMDKKEMKKLCSQGGGLTSWFDTSDAPKVYYEMVRRGDKEAERVWNAMLYQIRKWICMMAAPLEGKVDAILLTGGLLRVPGVIDNVTEGVSWIAPVKAYPGEFENDAMLHGALGVLRGEIQPKTYTGKPVWDGFHDEKENA